MTSTLIVSTGDASTVSPLDCSESLSGEEAFGPHFSGAVIRTPNAGRESAEVVKWKENQELERPCYRGAGGISNTTCASQSRQPLHGGNGLFARNSVENPEATLGIELQNAVANHNLDLVVKEVPPRYIYESRSRCIVDRT